ncbi:MAG: PepSY-like domain-containing protein [Paludibacteraceae bacterium]|nr:PepSY-like domain-containing protein [Paludibacteraceae bacterium]
MKRFGLIALICTMSMVAWGANKQPVALTALPQALQDSIAAHYTPDQILIVTSEKTAPRHYEYEFRVADGTKLKYSDKAVLMKIENEKGIDLSYVPSGIQNYVKETFPNTFIVEYTRATMKQEVELNIDVTLVFDKNGRFIRLD